MNKVFKIFKNIFYRMRYLGFARSLNIAYLKYIKLRPRNKDAQGLPPISVLTPCGPNDLEKLPLVIEYARKNILHAIENYIVVTPDIEKCKAVLAENKVHDVIVKDEGFLPDSVRKMSLIVNGVDRTGWIKQQLIKLSADDLSPSKFILVIDADTIFIKKTRFYYDRKYLFFISSENHRPYYDTFTKLLPKCTRIYPGSFISHHILFDRRFLGDLKREIESHSGESWQSSILKSLDTRETSSFSEYETYGNFVFNKFRKKTEFQFFDNLALETSNLSRFPSLEARLESTNISSVSLHHYIKSQGFEK